MRTRRSGFERLLIAVALGLAAVIAYFLWQRVSNLWEDYRARRAQSNSGEAKSSSAEPAGGEAPTHLPPLSLKKVGEPNYNPRPKAPPPPPSKKRK